ncbi:helix-turn-helix transcriptional regulator [Mycobacterium sp. PS03-16]|nr:helix-turn-helix transcriptional regulator [Mycobacterium sp. PS03-16]
MAALDSVVGGGSGRCLVIEGEPGLGKTTLMTELAARAGAVGFRELRCAGVHSQSEIGFAGLHELIYPLLGHAQRLPSRQRVAVLTAFGIDEGPTPERLLINLAVLGLIEEASQEQPLVLIVDDAQWLDPSTLDVLTFVGRRLANAAALMLCAVRPDTAGQPRHLNDLPHLQLTALDSESAATLLDQIIDGNAALHGLQEPTRARILAEASGNPLAVLELAAAIADEGVHDQPLSDAPLPTTRRIENAFLGQLACLTDEEQTLLLLVATAGTLTVRELSRAAEKFGVGDRELGTLHSCGLMKINADRLEVRHPLIRSAIYGAANLPERAAAHRALAAALDNPTRATWHTAAATYGPDEAVAAELEHAAAAASATGAHAEAVAALRRAAAISPEKPDKVRRLTSAAESARMAGLGADAIRIVDEAIALQPPVPEAAQLEVTRYVLAAMGGVPGRSVAELVRLAERFGRVAEPRARYGQGFLLAAASIRWRMYGQHRDERDVIADGLRRARTADAAEPVVAAMLQIAEASIDHRRRASSFAAQAKSMTDEFHADPLLLSAIALAGEYTWNLDAAIEGWTALAQCAAALDSPVHECDALRGRAQFQIHTGGLREARVTADAALRLADSTDLLGEAAAAAAILARASAWRGDFRAAETAIADGYDRVSSDPGVVWNAHLQWASGLAALTAGDAAKAVADLSRLAAHPQMELWAVGDLTEAAIAAGQPDLAQPSVQRALDEAAHIDSPFLTMLSQRCLAELSADPDDAEARFVTAIAAGANSNATLELARTQLAFGQWLRRRRRIVASREHLAAAAHTFTASGARPWADIANAELRAAGVHAGPATFAPATESLTAQELHIAQLAADGLTNREIADRIYLSHRTVAAHLYHVFPKLGVTTRSQLAAALQSHLDKRDS